jgi:hypothetical protein
MMFMEPERQAVAHLLVTECGDNLPLWHDKDPQGLERIRFAVLKLSNGSMPECARAVQIAQKDWRDVLVAAGFGHDIRAHLTWLPDGPRPS